MNTCSIVASGRLLQVGGTGGLHRPIARLPHCRIALLPYCLIALLPYCLTALLPYCLIAQLPDYPPYPMYP